MRLHHVIAVVALTLIGFGVKVFFFSAPDAEANMVYNRASMNVLQMHIDHPNNLPVQDVKDPM